MSSELSREEAIVAAAYRAAANGNTWDYCARWAKSVLEQAPPDIRSALSGGGGGEKAIHMTIGSLDGRRGDAYFWRDAAEVAESCLAAVEKALDEQHVKMVRIADEKRAAEESKSEAARIAFENGRASAVVLASDGRSGDAATWRDRCLDAEKRAEEAECSRDNWKASMESLDAQGYAVARERDALKAELAEAKKQLASERQVGECGKAFHDLACKERDAALARVKTLERDREIVVSALQEATAKIRTSRDAAGAQP